MKNYWNDWDESQELAALVGIYGERECNTSGGHLHNCLDDGNHDDGNIMAGWDCAMEHKDWLALEIMQKLVQFDVESRMRITGWYKDSETKGIQGT